MPSQRQSAAQGYQKAGGDGVKTTAIANWFGSNRMLAEHVGRVLDGCSWVGVPFAGGMCELAHIGANVMLVSDLHRHVINLARVIQSQKDELARYLSGLPFHPEVLECSQLACRRREMGEVIEHDTPLHWAIDYFVCSWMARAGTAGTEDEFNGSMSIRWKAGGGDSAVRFRSATESLTEWQNTMRRCTFVCLDVFEFLDQCAKRDIAENGIYLDPPFPGPGDAYRHKFTEESHRKLAKRLLDFRHAKIVCRFYDHPLIRELYPDDRWEWLELEGRKQTNDAAPEVLLVSRRTEGSPN